MYLHNLHIVNDDDGIKTICLQDNRIKAVGTEQSFPFYEKDELSLSFEHAIVFPGLINSHDHLDFNLFPKLGNRLYHNYAEWGTDIHQKNKKVIDKVLKVPHRLRLQWGIYKNLLNGITTVVHHGEPLVVNNDLITVFQKCQSLHSIRFEKGWRYKLNMRNKKHLPVVIHIGEGTDKAAKREIDTLLRWNLLKREIIGVHNVAMNERQAASFKALVWCPASNYFLFGRTANINILKDKAPVIFGTDSTLTSGWDLWEQLQVARQSNRVSDRELFDMLTVTPANVWQLSCCGKITEGCQANLVVAKMKKSDALNSFFAINPADILLVLHKGNIQLFDEELYQQLAAKEQEIKNFNPICIGRQTKYLRGDLPALSREIRNYYPEAHFPFTVPRKISQQQL